MLRRELPKTKTNARKTEEKLSQTLLTSTCGQATGQREKRKEKERKGMEGKGKTILFGVNLKRSQEVYRAGQDWSEGQARNRGVISPRHGGRLVLKGYLLNALMQAGVTRRPLQIPFTAILLHVASQHDSDASAWGM